MVFDAKDCKPIPHEVSLYHDAPCPEGDEPGTWAFSATANDATSIVPNGPTSGTWLDPSNPAEAASIAATSESFSLSTERTDAMIWVSWK